MCYNIKLLQKLLYIILSCDRYNELIYKNGNIEVMEMPLTKIAAENFTVFEDIKIPFCVGLNV